MEIKSELFIRLGADFECSDLWFFVVGSRGARSSHFCAPMGHGTWGQDEEVLVAMACGLVLQLLS